MKNLGEAPVDRVPQRRRDVIVHLSDNRTAVRQRSETFGCSDVRTPGAADSGRTFGIARGVTITRTCREKAAAVAASGDLTEDAESQTGLFLDYEMDEIVRHICVTRRAAHRNVRSRVVAAIPLDTNPVPAIVDPLKDHVHRLTLGRKRAMSERLLHEACVAPTSSVSDPFAGTQGCGNRRSECLPRDWVGAQLDWYGTDLGAW